MGLSHSTSLCALILTLIIIFSWFNSSLLASICIGLLTWILCSTGVTISCRSRTTTTLPHHPIPTNQINTYRTNNFIPSNSHTAHTSQPLRHRSPTTVTTTTPRTPNESVMQPSTTLPTTPTTDVDSVYTHTLLQSLLQQARVHLAQGQPSKALSCVLAAVRHQRGEEGVFQVLNETREAHGLRRLPVPPIAQQLGEGSQIPTLPSPSAVSSSAVASSTSGFHSWRNDGGGQEDSMMVDDEQSTTATSLSNEPVDPDLVTSLFRRLGMNPTSPTAAAGSSSTTSASAFTAASHTGPPMPQDFLPNSGYPSTSSATSSSRGVFHRSDYMNDDDFEALTAESTIAHGPVPPIHYPALRTHLPALSGGTNSSTMLEEIHAPRMNHPTPSAAFPSSSSSSTLATANGTIDSAAPILCSNGREDILHMAYDSDTSVICYQCSALIPKARFEAHLNYWCQAAGH